jgi:response regulator RpfG family c-di-GMP phosphodiesterase
MEKNEINDTLTFQDEGPHAQDNHLDTWKVLIVDDEEEVHHISVIVLSSTTFLNRKIEFLSAYNSSQARELLEQHSDIAVILLDVVMESDDSGLKLVQYIREKKNNRAVRIILRTGQPGRAPEEKVIVDYDINDYKAKTELTAQKLKTSVLAAIRSYRDIVTIEKNRRGLERIIDSSTHIFEIQSFKKLASGVLYQLASIINADENALYANITGVTAMRQESDFVILVGSGRHEKSVGKYLQEELPPALFDQVKLAIHEKKSRYIDGNYIGYIETKSGIQNLIILEDVTTLSPLDLELISVFCINVSIAFENVSLNEEIETSQKEVIITLGEMIERRSHETGYHVKRVSEYVRELSKACGVSDTEADLIAIASALHDVGKIAIPDGVLEKPGKLDPNEWEIMKTHAKLGQELLQFSQRAVFKTAAVIAGEHHERWDGQGYPQGLKGEEIDLKARITALADVFDALACDRVYRKAWSIEDTIDYIKKNSGAQFDPTLVELFQKSLPTFLAIRDQFSDVYTEVGRQ